MVSESCKLFKSFTTYKPHNMAVISGLCPNIMGLDHTGFDQTMKGDPFRTRRVSSMKSCAVMCSKNKKCASWEFTPTTMLVILYACS